MADIILDKAVQALGIVHQCRVIEGTIGLEAQPDFFIALEQNNPMHAIHGQSLSVLGSSGTVILAAIESTCMDAKMTVLRTAKASKEVIIDPNADAHSKKIAEAYYNASRYALAGHGGIQNLLRRIANPSGEFSKLLNEVFMSAQESPGIDSVVSVQLGPDN